METTDLMSRREAGPGNRSIDDLDDEPVVFRHQDNYAIRVPREQLGRFAEQSEDEAGRTRVVSFLFTNVSGIFPGQLPTIERDES